MFRVGQKVVCIRSPGPHVGARYPVKGLPYTIRGIITSAGKELLWLDEINNSDMCGAEYGPIEPGYNSVFFRPILDRKTDISIFTAMLNTSKRGVDA